MFDVGDIWSDGHIFDLSISSGSIPNQVDILYFIFLYFRIFFCNNNYFFYFSKQPNFSFIEKCFEIYSTVDSQRIQKLLKNGEMRERFCEWFFSRITSTKMVQGQLDKLQEAISKEISSVSCDAFSNVFIGFVNRVRRLLIVKGKYRRNCIQYTGHK